MAVAVLLVKMGYCKVAVVVVAVAHHTAQVDYLVVCGGSIYFYRVHCKDLRGI